MSQDDEVIELLEKAIKILDSPADLLTTYEENYRVLQESAFNALRKTQQALAKLKEKPPEGELVSDTKGLIKLCGEQELKIDQLEADNAAYKEIIHKQKTAKLIISNVNLIAEIEELKAWQQIIQNDVDKAHDDEVELLGLRDKVEQLEAEIAKRDEAIRFLEDLPTASDYAYIEEKLKQILGSDFEEIIK